MNNTTPKTSHELAEILLSLPDKPVLSKHYSHDGFDDYGYYYFHTIEVQQADEEVIIYSSLGELVRAECLDDD